MRNIDTNKGHIRRTAGVLAALVCILLIPTVSLAAGFGPDDRVDGMRFATDLAFYAGAFSTAVTASVNPFTCAGAHLPSVAKWSVGRRGV